MSETSQIRDRIGALTKGLGTKQPSQICAAVYLKSKLNGFPNIVDDFTYDAGVGMDSETIRRYILPPIYDSVDFHEYPDYTEDIEDGQFLQHVDNMQEAALYLYHIEEGEVPAGMKRKVKELQNRKEEMDAFLSDLQEQLDS